MNKVAERCKKDSCAKFFFASKKMFFELKCIKIVLYLLNIVPVVICFLPTSDGMVKLICSCVSFGFTLINLIVGALLSNYKEKAIMGHQIYEAAITGSTFSKTEYDRECTNDMQELAIRKGLPLMKKAKTLPITNVPQDISDDYSFLYLCRINAAKIKFLLSRVFYGYVICLVAIAVALIIVNFNADAGYLIYTLVCCWSLITPLINNCTSSQRCMRQCSKICADIDNFFADGDCSVERLARFYYYVQNIEFEMLLNRPTIFKFVEKMYKRGVNALTDGVTQRFKEAIVELKQRNLVLKGVLSQPKGKGLITAKDYDLEYLKRKEKEKQLKKAQEKAALKGASTALYVQPESGAKKAEPVKTEVKKPEVTKKAEPVKAEVKKPETKKTETVKPEVKKSEPKKEEPKKTEAKKPEVKKTETKKPEPGKQQPAAAKKPEPAKQQLAAAKKPQTAKDSKISEIVKKRK